MLAFCIDCYTRTDGCFDVTVHSDCHTQESVHTVRLSPGEQTLFFSRPGVTINLSGFLKGYALEKIRPLLRQFGVDNALVNMGNSSVLALGCQPQAKVEGEFRAEPHAGRKGMAGFPVEKRMPYYFGE